MCHISYTNPSFTKYSPSLTVVCEWEKENRRKLVWDQKVRWRQVISSDLHWRENQPTAAEEGRETTSRAPSEPRGLLLPSHLSTVTRGKPGFEPDMKQTPPHTRESSTRSQVGKTGSGAARVGGKELSFFPSSWSSLNELLTLRCRSAPPAAPAGPTVVMWSHSPVGRMVELRLAH